MKRNDFLTFAAALALTAPAGVQAQDARIFVTSTDNTFAVVDFTTAPPTTQTAGVAQGSNFQGLAVRGSGSEVRVLVTSSTQGGQLLIFDPDAGPDGAVVAENFPGNLSGLTVDGAGNVFAVSGANGYSKVWAILRKPGCDAAAMAAVGDCLPGGYKAPVKIVHELPFAVQLADIKVAPYSGAGFAAGDLLIASSNPGKLYCIPDPLADYNEEGHCAWGIYSTALLGFEPTGLAFAPSGDLLVSVRGNSGGGDVRLLSPPNAATSSSFVGGTPGNATAVSVGRVGSSFNVLVATHNGGAVHRYDLAGALLDSATDDLQAPRGLGSLTATLAAPTPAGSNQKVRSAADEITFDVVTGSGLTTMQAYVIEDTRPGVQGPDLSQPLGADLKLHEVLPPEIVPEGVELVIPAHFRPRTDLNNPGRKIIVLFQGDTSAAFAGTINHHIFEHFGAEADCSATESWRQPRLLWAKDTGGTMEDITSGCGSDVGRAWRFSWFALVHDTRSLSDALDAKLTTLGDVTSCFGSRGRTPAKAIDKAQRDARRGRYCEVQAGLEELAAGIDATAGTCEAETVARTLSAGYTASLLCN